MGVLHSPRSRSDRAATPVTMKRILVIEDHPKMLRNLVTILQMEGFQALAATDGQAGLEIARHESPDLILCDVMMPVLDGYGVLEALRADARTATIPFIFLTAKGQKAEIRAGMNLGADDYLTKPVTTDDLLNALRTRLRRQQAHDARVDAARTPFAPDFSSPIPLEALGLTAREAEVVLWVAQGKSNADIATILGMQETTVKKHLAHVFEKLGVESRNAVTLQALETLAGPKLA